MKPALNTKAALGAVLFVTGVLVGMLFSSLAVWGDMESTYYGFSKQASRNFTGLDCPIFIAAQERQTVRVSVRNSLDRTIAPNVRIEVSTPGVFDTTIASLKIAPGERGILAETVGPENIDLSRFIFVKALVYNAYPMPTQENTCGIFVLPLPGNGRVISYVMMFLSVVLSLGGFVLLYQVTRDGRKQGLYGFMVLVVFLAMAFSFLGWWLQSGMMLIILIILAVAFIATLTVLLR